MKAPINKLLARVRYEDAHPPINLWTAKLEILFGAGAASMGIATVVWAISLGDGLFETVTCAMGMALVMFGIYLALAGHRSHIYHSNNLLLAKLEQRDTQRGLTMLEIMVVLAIIGMVTAIIVPSLMATKLRAERKATFIQLKELADGVEQHAVYYQRYPAALDALQRTNPPILERAPKDAWQQDFVYTFPGTNARFDLSSIGQDGMVGTEDDITSWEEFHE